MNRTEVTAKIEPRCVASPGIGYSTLPKIKSANPGQQNVKLPKIVSEGTWGGILLIILTNSRISEINLDTCSGQRVLISITTDSVWLRTSIYPILKPALEVFDHCHCVPGCGKYLEEIYFLNSFTDNQLKL